MKKLLLSISIVLISGVAFAQFGGGFGTEEDPYRIYTKVHLEELSDSLNLLNTFTGKHFRLMNNIEEPILNIGSNKTFNGSFNGGGYRINLDLSNGYLFGIIGINGILDSLKIVGNTQNFISMVSYNEGVIRNCISDVTIIHPVINAPSDKYGICDNNLGIIESCVNLADFTNVVITNTGGVDIGIMSGICRINYGTIRNCINKGNSQVKFAEISGIANENLGIIELCINVGNLFSDSQEYCTEMYPIAGIVCTSFENSTVKNCINTGNIGFHSGLSGGGIISDAYSYTNNCLIENCFNSGKIYGYVGEFYRVSGGGITGLNGYIDINNCLNIGNNGGGAIIDTCPESTFSLVHNYYDKQMCLSKGIAGEDIPGSAEGKLTTQLTGTSPELQAMLGDGWSYAEGRYPIPLGLENDSLALMAATPVYLHFTTEDAYNHVDSVSKNFTVTTGVSTGSTTVAFDWDETNGRVSFSDENVTLLSVGIENLIVSLGDYSKNVKINIVDIETSVSLNTVENSIRLYPNPASNVCFIDNGQNIDEIIFFDLSGKVVLDITEYSTDGINIESLMQGIYVVEIKTENGFTYKKLVVE
ncbi:MAG TPA: T9SS type A sorting domain-containing protein [Bacteroidales bacterium]|nr:T9SS type A sorting domain-containing protein [Bacteroidales bacterium]